MHNQPTGATNMTTYISLKDTNAMIRQENTMQAFAHYYGSKSRGFTVLINNSASPVGGTEYPVSGKLEARAIAKQHGATPYNF